MSDLLKVFNKQVTASYQVAQPEQKTPFWSSGAFVSDTAVRSAIVNGAGQVIIPIITMPTANVEPNYGNTVKNDIAVGRMGGATRQRANVAFVNEGFVESSLQAYLAGLEPNKMIAEWVDLFWSKQAENRAIAIMAGVYNKTSTSHKADFVLDASTGKTEAIDINAVIDVEAMLPQEYRNGGVVIMHPKKKADLVKQDAIKSSKPSDGGRDIETYNGRIIIESTINTKIDDKYLTAFVGSNAFVADSVSANNDMEVSRTADTGNGAGHTTLWTRRNMLIHPQGFDFTATTLTGGTKNEAISASWADLQDGTNWDLVSDASSTPIRFLISK